MSPRAFVGFRLDPDKLAEIDQAAAEAGVSRSDIIRRAVEQYLKRRRDHERKQR